MQRSSANQYEEQRTPSDTKMDKWYEQAFLGEENTNDKQIFDKFSTVIMTR